MQTIFWSRRRLIATLAATAAVAATPLTLAPMARAATAQDPPLDPLALPDTDRAKVVKAWLTGGRATKAAAADALYGTDTQIRAFLGETLPKVVVEDNRVAIVSYLARSGKGLRREAVAAPRGGGNANAPFHAHGDAPPRRGGRGGPGPPRRGAAGRTGGERAQTAGGGRMSGFRCFGLPV
ncbi:hypothetical protein ACFXAZ_26150, partial [Streptomyces sp. NPDC059477]